MRHLKFIFFVFITSFTGLAAAETDVTLPEDELARESVLPKFDSVVSVKNKNVSLAKKIEIVPYIGWNFTEAIFNQMKYGAIFGYHLSDDHAVSVNVASWATGLSQYGDQLRTQQGLLFEQRAPRPVMTVSGAWEITSYYGKISLTKQTVGNISLYPIIGAGATTYTHKTYFNLNGGVGMKLYFTRSLALRTDLRLQYGQQTEPFLLARMQSGQQVPQADNFPEKWIFSTIVDVGLAILF